MTGLQRTPRTLALRDAWLRVAGVGLLTGPDGGPLSRVVKLILVPLVLRPLEHPAVAGDLLDPDGVAELEHLVLAARFDLAATAAWFAVLKAARRRLAITAGSPQDRYLQRCFEVAVTRGEPQQDSAAVAEAVLRELEEDRAGRSAQDLADAVADRREELDARLAELWATRASRWPTGSPEADALLAAAPGTTARDRADIPATAGTDSTVGAGALPAGSAAAVVHASRAGTGVPPPCTAALLDALPTGSAEADALLAAACSARSGARAGTLLWAQRPASCWGGTDTRGLASELPLATPRLGEAIATAELPPPLERSVWQRCFSALRAGAGRNELPPVADLLDDEVERSCAPFGLLAETGRVLLLLGGHLATALAVPADGPAQPTEAHRALRRAWERERIVQRSRRLTTSVPPAEPSVRYTRRLWARLHGRDVRAAIPLDAAGCWDLLEGVGRSVILDQRAHVRRLLSGQEGTR